MTKALLAVRDDFNLAESEKIIRREFKAISQHDHDGLEHKMIAGDEFLRVKANLGHGKYLEWRDREFPGSRSTADRCCALAEFRDLVEAGIEEAKTSGLTYSETKALEEIRAVRARQKELKRNTEMTANVALLKRRYYDTYIRSHPEEMHRSRNLEDRKNAKDDIAEQSKQLIDAYQEASEYAQKELIRHIIETTPGLNVDGDEIQTPKSGR